MTLTETEKAALVYRARIAEQAERWQDMAKAMGERLEGGGPLNFQEGMLMAIAFKNVAAPVRVQWKLAVQARVKYVKRGLEARANMATQTAKGAATELRALCKQVLALLPTLQPEDADTAALLAKLAADYSRYDAEAAESKAVDTVAAAYKRAATACAQLPPTSSVRLGTALNYAVFQHDMQQQPAAAIAIAAEALQAMGGQEPTGDRYANLAAALLRSNVSLWQAEEAKSTVVA